MLEIPKNAKSILDFPVPQREAIDKLDEVFWEKISKMKIGKIFNEVNPIGGNEKAEAVKNIAKRLGSRLSDVMYVGDSITDVSAFQQVRKEGGLTVSFNGNAYAVREAEIAVLSENAIVTSVLVDTFNRFGRTGVFQLVNEWSHQALQRCGIDSTLQKRILELYPKQLPKVERITLDNKEQLMKESSVFRKSVRGEAVGKLG